MNSSPILHLSIPVGNLDEARRFYVDVLDCRLGRVRDEWFDVWFFGLQLTLQLRPDEVRPADQQGVAHFGVVLRSRKEFDALVARLNASGAAWITPPEIHTDPVLSAKVGGKLSDPSGNVIEFKYYEDVAELELG
jgi:extradiol dioxygenase family protein